MIFAEKLASLQRLKVSSAAGRLCQVHSLQLDCNHRVPLRFNEANPRKSKTHSVTGFAALVSLFHKVEQAKTTFAVLQPSEGKLHSPCHHQLSHIHIHSGAVFTAWHQIWHLGADHFFSQSWCRGGGVTVGGGARTGTTLVAGGTGTTEGWLGPGAGSRRRHQRRRRPTGTLVGPPPALSALPTGASWCQETRQHFSSSTELICIVSPSSGEHHHSHQSSNSAGISL